MKRNLLLAACSLLLALILFEVVLRTTHVFNAPVSWTEPDPLIGWRSSPGKTSWEFAENDHPVSARINQMGWRDHERSRSKAAGTTRVAVVGDSYVEALQVEVDSTFVAVAERRANAHGERRYEFMNFGRSGMGQAEEHIVLERDVLPCGPDIVVLVYTPTNDVADASRATSFDLQRPFYVVDEHDSLVLDTSFRESKHYRVRERLKPLRQRSALLSLLAWRFNVWRGRDAAALSRWDPVLMHKLTSAQTLMTARPDSLYLANYRLTKRIVLDMARVCARHGVALILMSVPLEYEDETIAKLRSVDPTFDADFFDGDFAAMADTSGFGFVPLTGAFSARWRKTGEPLYWAHWNYGGHRLVGELLAEAVSGARGAPSDHH